MLATTVLGTLLRGKQEQLVGYGELYIVIIHPEVVEHVEHLLHDEHHPQP